jgi:uncharacterized protein YbjT (DUF2867 family)
LEKAKTISSLAGAEIVVGDLNNTESIIHALNGIKQVFLLTNSSEQAETLQCNFTDTAWLAGVEHIVKLSQLLADLYSPVRFLRYHAVVEEKIKQSGMAYTSVRTCLCKACWFFGSLL